MKEQAKKRNAPEVRIPNGNRRSRARRLRQATSLQSQWMRGQRIGRQKQQVMLLLPLPW